MHLVASPVVAGDAIPVVRSNLTNSAEDKIVDIITTSGVERLAVDALVTGNANPSQSTNNILRQNEITVSTKTKTDLPSSTYTVASGKTFALSTFGGSFDTQSPMYLRLEKQTGGTGSFVTLFRVTLKQHGQDESNYQVTMPQPVIVGTAGDVFKITYESALAKGKLWAGFVGLEY